jgi:hypothetical protein
MSRNTKFSEIILNVKEFTKFRSVRVCTILQKLEKCNLVKFCDFIVLYIHAYHTFFCPSTGGW